MQTRGLGFGGSSANPQVFRYGLKKAKGEVLPNLSTYKYGNPHGEYLILLLIYLKFLHNKYLHCPLSFGNGLVNRTGLCDSHFNIDKIPVVQRRLLSQDAAPVKECY